MSDRAASDKYPTGSTAKPYTDFDGNIVTLFRLVKLEPAWARSRIIVGEEALLRVTELEDALQEALYLLDDLAKLEVGDGGDMYTCTMSADDYLKGVNSLHEKVIGLMGESE